jgi:hypothetical protein
MPTDPSYCEDDDVYEVECIVDVRHRLGRAEYRIQWKGYPGEDTWEPEEHLDGCRDLLDEFTTTRRRAASKRQLLEEEEGSVKQHSDDKADDDADELTRVGEEEVGKRASKYPKLIGTSTAGNVKEELSRKEIVAERNASVDKEKESERERERDEKEFLSSIEEVSDFSDYHSSLQEDGKERLTERYLSLVDALISLKDTEVVSPVNEDEFAFSTQQE